MNWFEKLVAIKAKLSERGFTDTVERINNAQMTLGTPGEMYLEIMNVLLSIKKNSPAEYKVIESEVTDLIDYGKSINYFNPPDE